MILNSPYISGSLTVTGNTNLIGSLTVTGSLAGTATSSSFAYTASSAVSAYTASSAVNATTALTASYANTFTVGGTLTAQTLVVQTITSSVSYITGSTRFGSLLSNTHTFTGSMYVTGSTAYFAGNVGLGISTSPSHNLTIELAASSPTIRLFDGTNNNYIGGAFAAGNLATGTTAGNLVLRSSTGIALSTNNGSGVSMFVSSSGNVGIGTTSPLSILHILGQSGTTGLPSLLLYGESPSNGQRYGLNVSTDQLDVSALGANARMAFFTGGNASSITEKMRITSGGVLKIGNGGTADDGSNPGYKNVAISFNAAQNRGEIQAVQQGLLVYPLILNGAGGNIGIGTYSPTTQLNVQTGSASSYTGAGPGDSIRVSSGNTNVWMATTLNGTTAYFGSVSDNTVKFAGYNYASSSNIDMILGQDAVRIKSTNLVYIGGTSQLGSATLSTFGSVAARNSGVDGTYAEAFTAYYSSNNTESNAILTAVSSNGAQSGMRFDISNGAGSAARTTSMTINRGSVSIVGSLSKGSGTFKIDHPLESKKDTHYLVHSFIEGPRVDLIYRGKVTLVNGVATINIDESAGMTEGTFAALNRDVQCFTTNESGWDLVKGKVEGNILTITSNNSNSTDEISWMVIGERQDKHIKDTDWTDENGKPILEPLKTI